jgi:hypothetical protein
MKLNNAQIKALADKFYNEIKVKQDKKDEDAKLAKLNSFKPLYDRAIKILNENSDLIYNINVKVNNNGNIVSLRKSETFKQWIDNYQFRNLCSSSLSKKLTIENIKQDIILATIDSQSVEDIMKTLKTKYK